MYYPPDMVHHHIEQENRDENEQLQIIRDCNVLYDMLYFVLLWSDGGWGWYLNLIQRNGDKKDISSIILSIPIKRKMQSNKINHERTKTVTIICCNGLDMYQAQEVTITLT